MHMACRPLSGNWNRLQIYRAISEGIINLADCFFDMEYIDAQKGLEIYKQHTIDNDKLGVRSLLHHFSAIPRRAAAVLSWSEAVRNCDVNLTGTALCACRRTMRRQSRSRS